jgi:hypothetical protein
VGGTCLTDPEQLFNLTSDINANHEVLDLLDFLDPDGEVTITQTFEVPTLAIPFRHSRLKLELLVAEPRQDENYPLRSVAFYDLEMQLSIGYKFNPLSSFLLVINSAMPTSVIDQMTKFIQHDLQLQVDIFNLSLYGSFIDPLTKENVLSAYVGKSIVIVANQFPYFQSGLRFPFQLLNPRLVCSLAKGGTKILLSGQALDANLDFTFLNWSSYVILPPYPREATTEPQAGSVHGKPFKGFIKALALRNAEKVKDPVLQTHTFPRKRRLLKGDTMLLDLAMADKTLKQHFPLSRYTIARESTDGTKKELGRIVVSEGLPQSAEILASLTPHDASGEELTMYHQHMFVACLPFAMRASMFWNMVGMASPVGAIQSRLIDLKVSVLFSTVSP